MKHIKTQFAALILPWIIFAVASCGKAKNTEPQLPPETNTGAYTMGFKVDGKVYTAKGRGGLLSDQYVYYSYFADSTFNIGGGSVKNNAFSITLNFKCYQLNSICTLSEFPFDATFFDKSNGTVPGNANTYNTTKIYGGSVSVKYFNGTFAPGNSGSIVSGIFEFTAVNGNGKVIQITDGRFDIGN